ncbi:coiled-coil domain-containing protein 137 [Telopea speciosissima]|uniref:coiled-coil domain-containing protein 137 n=1 Tax=Telopea speciosissima TaxID=54955 RepID=UPI001CC65746|nr:coiled-coil domain-containing protein 137 [Telopea speciosissima]
MGGKGQRRRAKNFLAAHGGYTRLPPPPKPEEIDALPSKLRKLMEFTSSTTTKPLATKGSLKSSESADRKKKQKEKPSLEDALSINTLEFQEGGQDENVTAPKHKDNREEVVHTEIQDKKKAKRKRKQVHDLRFEKTIQDLGLVGSKRRDRKKKYLEERKKKHKKAKTEKNLDFPGREEIKFGEIVKAPPKLVAFPKALKTTQSASHERLRLQAVEAYRDRKGWESRPGIHIPSRAAVTPSS